MKLLILCDMFPPAFAPRMGYLCKYLKRAGWEPIVVTEYINENMFSFLTGNAPVTYVNYYSGGTIWRKIQWIVIFFLDFFFNYKDIKMYKVASAVIEKENIEGILCSTYRTFPLSVAQKLASHYNLPFVADTRDIIEQYVGDEYISKSFNLPFGLKKIVTKSFKKKLLRVRNKALRSADCVTTVSPWHVEVMKQYNPKVELIYNGFDPELFYPEKIVTPKFRITYTGRLVSLGIRDPRLFFEAISKLSKEKKIAEADFRIQWYVDAESQKVLEPLIAEYNIQQYMDFLGYVAANKIPSILNQSSILLQLANKSDASGPKGIMTTKLFEAFAVEKPMLCVRSDESFLEQAIKQANAGVSARTAEDVYTFVLDCYNEWKQNGFTSVSVDKDAIEYYSRKKQAEQFMNIFVELNKAKNG